MKVTIIHGQSHRGSTCNIARILAKNSAANMKNFFCQEISENFASAAVHVLKNQRQNVLTMKSFCRLQIQ